MAQINFGGVNETVVTREEFPLEKARKVLENETIAVIGYGVQGPGQSQTAICWLRRIIRLIQLRLTHLQHYRD